MPQTELSCVPGERHSAGLSLSKTSQSRTLDFGKPHVNGSGISLSTLEHLGLKFSYTFSFSSKFNGNASKPRIVFMLFFMHC